MNIETTLLKVLSLSLVICLSNASSATTLGDIAKAVSASESKINLRYRIEVVDQAGKDQEATASTLRSRFSWQSAPINQWSVGVEVDNVTVIGIDDYNSTNNGKTNYPVIADPKGTDLNQVNLRYAADNLDFIVGRQRIVHNNQRFIGGVAWRQNEQTYDATRIIYRPSESISVDYSYVFNVNRIFGPQDGAQAADWHGHFHLANAKFRLNNNHSINLFSYILDNEVAAATSSKTIGVDYSAKVGSLTANLSYATQSDAGDNPNRYDVDYYSAEVSGHLKKLKWRAGIETLGSDKGISFSTPLATLHKFQGFADKFLGTPTDGIEDLYAGISTKLYGVKLAATYHQFTAQKGNAEYGHELDLVATYNFNDFASGLLKFAKYNAESHGTDTTKFWLMTTIAF